MVGVRAGPGEAGLNDPDLLHALLNDAQGLGEDGKVGQLRRDPDDILLLIDDELGEIPVQPGYAPLRVEAGHAHVALVVQAGVALAAAPAHRQRHRVSGPEPLHLAPDFLNDADHLVAHGHRVAPLRDIVDAVPDHAEVRAVEPRVLDADEDVVGVLDLRLGQLKRVRAFLAAHDAYR